MQVVYDQFIERTAAARHMTPEKVDEIAQGRVWTGAQAKQLGLVDELGGLYKAIDLAKQRARIPADEEVELVVYPPHRSFYEVLADATVVAGGEVEGRVYGRRAAGAARAARAARPRRRPRALASVPLRASARAHALRVCQVVRSVRYSQRSEQLNPDSLTRPDPSSRPPARACLRAW